MEESKKVLEIEVPQGYEIDKENSTFDKIIFKKVEEKLTYRDIAEELFEYKKHYYINDDGCIMETSIGWRCPNAAPTEHQLKRLLAINKLMNVAYYLNSGWKPNWKDKSEDKYCIIFNGSICIVENTVWAQHGGVVFKSTELASQSLKILGEETIKLALGVI